MSGRRFVRRPESQGDLLSVRSAWQNLTAAPEVQDSSGD
jgi:hypothetical protein